MSALGRAHERLLTGLARRKVRDAEGLFVAEGVRVVEEMLTARVPLRLAVTSPALAETDRGAALLEKLQAGAEEVVEVGPGEMDRLAGTRTSQGVLVVGEMPRATLGDVPDGDDPVTVLVLDGVQDPGNLGTLTRSAAAFGCAGLLCLPGTVDPWNPKAVRASAGALFRLPVLTPAADEALDWLEEHGFAILGADAGGSDVAGEAVPRRAALVVGNEGAGLTAEVRDRCHRVVGVPMRRGTESLNVAVATGILLYVMTRGRE